MRTDHRRPLVAYALVSVACAFVVAPSLDLGGLGLEPKPTFSALSDTTITPSEMANGIIDPTAFLPAPDPQVVEPPVPGGHDGSGAVVPAIGAINDVLGGSLLAQDAAVADDGGTEVVSPPRSALVGGGGPADWNGNGNGNSGPGSADTGTSPDTGSDTSDGSTTLQGSPPSDGGPGTGSGAEDVTGGPESGPESGHGNDSDPKDGDPTDGAQAQEPKDDDPQDNGGQGHGSKDKGPKDEDKDKEPKDKEPKDKSGRH